MTSLAGKNVLVTGGCGSIGSHLVEEILKQDPSVVRVLDNNEEGLFNLQNELGEDTPVRYLLGDVRDQDRLELAMENIDVVFHAAALKHVTINEYNPFETVQTNVQGTQNLIRAALETEVESVVAVSTDKSSNPTSVMGATKLLSERLTIAANTYKGERETKFGCVRFGNVLGSSGSVVPLFMQQIRDGGPVTVTDPEMTRFIMPIEEAAALVLQAHERMTSGEVFVLKMPSFRVGTLAEAMVEEYAPRIGQSPEEIDIEIMGARPGERTHEKLVSTDESMQARELDDMYVILPQIDVPGYDSVNYADAEVVDNEYTSKDARRLPKNELIDLIEAASLDMEMPDKGS
ncbi:SDR family NAD(P)-dependent oxidoreductase [Halalkaliarchaeum sp. AArc-GB]|uniref:SDR family NAD(P)-dependent oxidoreductase n=1 Tax=Halalkaliarchaeum sp. AArc-GB TaxID=3074078 RepID=UPI00285FB897|nr:SDR family NAD(P)-dependent oxidoreductase [Halalkaliarchaeum sp. AArc-GB]MDR5674222.1 SDR family NAD(P)-dependent oxidoreductase [Halalkaliarchaeum sp. AArc-GB]